MDVIQASYVLDWKKRYPCPVCCRYFCRDYDLILAISDDPGGKNVYICESGFWDDFPCDFSVSEGLEPQEIDAIAQEKMAWLKEQSISRAP